MLIIGASTHYSTELISHGVKIRLPWQPFIMIPGMLPEQIEIPEGFHVETIYPNAEIIGAPLYGPDVSEFLEEGGAILYTNSVRAWHRFLHDKQQPEVLYNALHKFTAHPDIKKFYTRRGVIDLTTPKIMAIWNVTPDSFSSFCESGGAATEAHAEKLCRDGAEILDIGAESTRPGSEPITPEQEIDRLRKPLQWAEKNAACPISLDSRNIETISWALENNLTDIINDVALTTDTDGERENAICRAVRDSGAGLVLMAWQPHDAVQKPFDECIADIQIQLGHRLNCAWKNGVDLRRIVIDPGIGFGKGLDNDLELITRAPRLLEPLGRPVLIAHSRKRCLAKVTGLPIEQLDTPTAITTALSIESGADIIRVHTPALAAMARKLVRIPEELPYD